MQYRSKKLLSLLLAVLMIVSLLPSAAFATEGDDIEPVEPTESVTDTSDVEEEEIVDEEPAEEPNEEPAETPNEEPNEEPAETPNEEPAVEPTEETPAVEPTETPNEETPATYSMNEDFAPLVINDSADDNDESDDDTTTCVAKIDDNEYDSLQAAFDAAQSGQTITLLADVELTESIIIKGTLLNAGNSITLDGNNKTITIAANDVSALYFGDTSAPTYASGDITIKDLTINTADGITGKHALMFYGGNGSNTLENVTVEGSYITYSDYTSLYAVNLYGTSGATLIGCDLVSVFANAASGTENQQLKLVNSKLGTLYVNSSQTEGVDNFTETPKVILADNADKNATTIGTLVCADPSTMRVSKDVLAKATTVTLNDDGLDIFSVNDAKYKTFTEAANAAESGGTITLLRNVTDAGDLKLPAGVTFDGGNYTLSGNTCIHINAAGGTVQNVNFKDIHNEKGELSALYASGLTGKVTITGCTFDDVDWDCMQITPASDDAEITITNNTFTGNIGKRCIHIEVSPSLDYYYAYKLTANANILNATCGDDALGVYYFNKATASENLDISGNYINGSICVATYESKTDKTIHNYNERVLPLKDLKDGALVDSETTYVATVSSGWVTTFYTTLADAVAAAQSGDTVKLLADINTNENNKGTSRIYLNSKENITIDGNGHTITADLGPVNNRRYVLYLDSTTNATIKNLTINGTAGYAIYLSNCTNTTLEKVTVEGSYHGDSDYDFLSSIYAVNFYGNGGGTLIDCNIRDVFKNGAAYNEDDDDRLKIESSTIGNLFVNYTNGTYENPVAVYSDTDDDSTIEHLILGYGDTSRVSESVVNCANKVTTAAVKAEFTGSTGTQVYFTLAEAVKAAEDATSATITLLADATGDGVVFEEGQHKNLTIDFGGYTYTVTGTKNNGLVGSTGTETNGFQILEGNTVTLKNGTMKMNSQPYYENTVETTYNAHLIINYSDLTLDSLDLIGDTRTTYVLSNNCGEINITGSTSITATEGHVAFDACEFGSYTAPTVTVNTTGTITGKVEMTGGTLKVENGTFKGKIDYQSGTIAISGGFFDHAIEADWCAEGFAPVEMFNGTWSVKTDKAAMIGDKTYDTLQAAFDEVNDGETITLLKDIDAGMIENPTSLSYTNGSKTTTVSVLYYLDMANKTNVTIDGNGHTIKANNSNCSLFYFLNTSDNYGKYSGTVTVKNLTIDATAKVAIDSLSNADGQLYLENVTVKGSYNTWGYGESKYEIYAVKAQSSGYATLVNCNISSLFTNTSPTNKTSLTNSTVGVVYANSTSGTKAAKVTADSSSHIGTLISCDATSVYLDASAIAVATTVLLDNDIDAYVAPAARIGDMLYATLQDAVNAATDGNRINLLADYKDEAITVNKAITVVGNGYTAKLTAGNGVTMTATEIANTGDSTINIYSFTENISAQTVAKIGDVEYTTVEAALAAAKSGDTVVLIDNADESKVYLNVPAGVTLDLNGHTLTAAGLVAFTGAEVIDTKVRTSPGLLKVSRYNVSLRACDSYVPFWIEESAGYIFLTFSNTNNTYQNFSEQTSDSFTVNFRPSFGSINNEYVRTKYLNTKGSSLGLTMKVQISWTGQDGTTITQTYAYTDNLFKQAYAASGSQFSLAVTGLTGISKVEFKVLVSSDTGAEVYGSDTLVYTTPTT